MKFWYKKIKLYCIYLDFNYLYYLRQKTAIRNKRKLLFNDKGKYEDLANKLRTKTKLSLLQQEIAAISKKTGISNDSRLALIQPKRVTVSILNSEIILLLI